MTNKKNATTDTTKRNDWPNFWLLVIDVITDKSMWNIQWTIWRIDLPSDYLIYWLADKQNISHCLSLLSWIMSWNSRWLNDKTSCLVSNRLLISGSLSDFCRQTLNLRQNESNWLKHLADCLPSWMKWLTNRMTIRCPGNQLTHWQNDSITDSYDYWCFVWLTYRSIEWFMTYLKVLN